MTAEEAKKVGIGSIPRIIAAANQPPELDLNEGRPLKSQASGIMSDIVWGREVIDVVERVASKIISIYVGWVVY